MEIYSKHYKHWDYWGGLWPLSENTNYTNCNHQIKLGEETETLGRCPESRVQRKINEGWMGTLQCTQ